MLTTGCTQLGLPVRTLPMITHHQMYLSRSSYLESAGLIQQMHSILKLISLKNLNSLDLIGNTRLLFSRKIEEKSDLNMR